MKYIPEEQFEGIVLESFWANKNLKLLTGTVRIRDGRHKNFNNRIYVFLVKINLKSHRNALRKGNPVRFEIPKNQLITELEIALKGGK